MNKELRAFLLTLLERAHQQVQFAEAKNGALVALNFAGVASVGAILTASNNLASDLSIYLVAMGLSLLISGLIALWSFLPTMNNVETGAERETPAAYTNIMYSGHAAMLSSEAFLAAVIERLEKKEPADGVERDISNQVVINSNIARRKFQTFSIAAWTMGLGIALPTCWLAVRLIWFG